MGVPKFFHPPLENPRRFGPDNKNTKDFMGYLDFRKAGVYPNFYPLVNITGGLHPPMIPRLSLRALSALKVGISLSQHLGAPMGGEGKNTTV